MHDLRQELHVACPDTHDWAAVVAQGWSGAQGRAVVFSTLVLGVMLLIRTVATTEH